MASKVVGGPETPIRDRIAQALLPLAPSSTPSIHGVEVNKMITPITVFKEL
jgi:hypothetical protein